MSEDPIKSFKKAFNHFLEEENISQSYKERLLISSWGKIMGKPIASRTSKIFIKDRVMFVKLTSAPLKQEMTISKAKILALLEKEMDEKVVEDVRFL
ncbi:MAG: DUF721 domain-containing protein [Cyclobacteriaceae bacterium]|nr:DUF721 domain-containing protein [Cyclobacteriaceae bacterium HetDA_MAG_MS6]